MPRFSKCKILVGKFLTIQHALIKFVKLFVLVYNSGNQNVLINDWYACLQVLTKQLYMWNAYLSLPGYKLVIAGL